MTPGARLSRRSLLAGAAALPVAAQAQSWPSQPFRVVVPYPPGGLTDVLGRLIGERLQMGFGQPAVIDNKPGAATQLGASYVAKAPPDGYTLLLATVSTLCITPALHARPLINHADFAPVATMGRVVLFLVCRPDLPVADPGALVAMLQARPDGYSYGRPGVGTAHHLLVELIRSKMPFSATHVPRGRAAQWRIEQGPRRPHLHPAPAGRRAGGHAIDCRGFRRIHPA